jgi:hypothetical protein
MRKISFIIILFILTIAIQSIADQKCALCGKTITGQYYRFEDGSIYCMDCMNNKTKCAICGKPSNSTVLIDNKQICPKCLAGLKRCSFCNRPIAGDYTAFPELGLILCDKCSKTIPRCDICGKPDKNLIRAGNKHICRSCYNKSAFCYICGSPIDGEYTWFDGDSTKKYCQNCINKYPRCACCGAPAGKDSHKLNDGRILCNDCYREGYFDVDKVRVIKNNILEYLKSGLGMTIEGKIRYTLQGQDFIKSQSEGISGDLNGLFYRQNNDLEIYVLYGLRQKDLYQVISHEIAHAWASDNCRLNLTLEEAEGFAQWVAYYTLRHFNYTAFSQTLLEGDTVYSRGLKKMLEIEKKGGRDAVFKYLAR